jgi:hypothetical protein
MKRLLFIAFYFPPRNNIACYRTGCFAKFLPQYGWLPTVICQDWPGNRPDSDPDFVGALPEAVQIYRISGPSESGPYQRVWLRKLAPYLWPHRAPILWWQQARRRIAALLETNQYDAIWATSDPLTPLTLALEASRSARLPWVADIRDCLNEQKFGSWYKRPLFRHQERRLCRLADRVVTVSEGLSDVLRTFTNSPVSIIPNGFDPSLLPSEKPAANPLFTILYAGTLVMGRQDPRPVFQALNLCLDRGLIPRGEIELQFLGTKPESVREVLAGFPPDLPVRVLPRVKHRAALELQTQASLLLLLAHGSERGIMTGKVFDYLATGRPILAVPDDRHTTSRLLSTTRAGVALTDPEPIARQLSEWYQRWRADHFFTMERNESEVMKYSRSAQAGELARLLNEMSTAHRSNSR